MNKYIQALEDLDRGEPKDRLASKKLLIACINRPSYRKYRSLQGENKRLKCENERLKAQIRLLKGKQPKHKETALESFINEMFEEME